uniref:Ig-like domain-containing protein n=1 Tax=Cyprinus carpio TaxID=7962 RepID=A0A8C1JVE1_CYPCA
ISTLFNVLRFYSPLPGNTEADTIKPLSLSENRHVGESVNLSCSYKDYTGNIQNLQWYRQYPRSKPEFLLYIFPQGLLNRPPRFTAEVNQENKQVDLNISSAVETDSAIYYCALVPTLTGNLTTSYKNLHLASMLQCSCSQDLFIYLFIFLQ